MSTAVTLTWPELMIGASAGIMRQVQNLRARRKDRFGCDPEDGWTAHIEGACGEMAVAKLLGKFWSGSIGNLQADDVGQLQVRTRSKSHYDLIVHPSDRDDRAFIHVTGIAPTYHVVGWILGRDAKQKSFWRDPAGGRPAFFVPASALHPLDELEKRGGANAEIDDDDGQRQGGKVSDARREESVEGHQDHPPDRQPVAPRDLCLPQ